MTQLIYKLKLETTYYNQGFFNLGVEVERFVSQKDCEMRLLLGNEKVGMTANMSRKYNNNGTPRVFGKAKLQNWFWKNFDLNADVEVIIIGQEELWIRGQA